MIADAAGRENDQLHLDARLLVVDLGRRSGEAIVLLRSDSREAGPVAAGEGGSEKVVVMSC